MAHKFKGDIRVEGSVLLPNETASRALELDGSGNLQASSVTSTELGYLSGVTSAIQTQLDAKAVSATLASTSNGEGASLIGIEDAAAQFTATTVEGALAEALDAAQAAQSDIDGHLDGGASKHDATEIDYERLDGSKKNIQASSDDVENALTDLDDAIGSLAASPSNYTPSNAAIVADHLSAIDTALSSAGGTDFSDATFRISDDGDSSKKIAFQASGITTSTVRTITMPDADVTLHDPVTVVDSAEIDFTLTGQQITAVLVAGSIDETKLDASVNASLDLADSASQPGHTHTASEITDFDAAVTGNSEVLANSAARHDAVTLNADDPTQQTLNLSGQELQVNLATISTDGAMSAEDKAKLDGIESGATADQSATEVPFTPDGDIAASNVQTAIVEVRDDTDTKLSAKLNLSGGTMSGNIAMGGNSITGMADPSAAQDAATKAYVDAVAEGLRPKEAVRVATTAAGTLATSFEDGDTVDGVTLATGDRILIKDQAAPAENGIYVVAASGAPTRATDFDSLSPIDEINGAYVAVQEGTANAGKLYVQTGTVATIGTDAINFVFFNSTSGLVGGDGITISGSNVSVDHDGEGLTFVSNQLALELDGTTLAKSATGLEVADGGITNTQVNASAAIDLSKLATLTADRALQSSSSGVIEVSAVTSTELGHLSGVTSAIQTQLDAKAEASAGDIAETSFSIANNQAVAANVTGLAFSNATVRSFKAQVSIVIDATADLYEVYELTGIQKGASWDMAQVATGDDSQVLFTITSAGQVQYTSGNYAGFSSGTIKFRAETTSV